MHKTIKEAIILSSELKRQLFEIDPQILEIVIFPAFTALSEVAEVIYDSNIKLGAQNVHWEKEGAFTGEICVPMLKEIGCKYIIVGHSERRSYFKEDDRTINKKLKAVLKEGLFPIFCVGETLEEREKNITFKVLEKQVFQGLESIESLGAEKIVVAYEPVWAIGTGKTATPLIAQEAQAYIRELLRQLYGEVSATMRILYGGSVKPENIKELMEQPDIDGALVGGASLDPLSFANIVKYAYSIKKCTD